jgi:hypothetical protein
MMGKRDKKLELFISHFIMKLLGIGPLMVSSLRTHNPSLVVTYFWEKLNNRAYG